MFHFCHLLSVVNIWYLFIIFSFAAQVVWLATASILTFLIAQDICRHEIIIFCFPATLSLYFAFHLSRIIRWSHSWDIYSRSCGSTVIGSLRIFWVLPEEESAGQSIAFNKIRRSIYSSSKGYFSTISFLFSLYIYFLNIMFW